MDAWNTRKLFRIFIESPVVMRINRAHRTQVKLAKQNIEGKILDLSRGGSAVQCEYFIPKGTRVNLFVDRAFLATKGAEHRFKGRTRIVSVVRSAVGGRDRKYRLGLEFLRMSRSDGLLIEQLVQFVERRKHPRLEFGK